MNPWRYIKRDRHTCRRTDNLTPLIRYTSYSILPSIHQSISILDSRVVRVPFYGVGSTRLCRTPAFHASLSSGSKSAGPHLSTSVFTHSDHVFQGLPSFLVPTSGKCVTELINVVARCTRPYHLRRRQRRTDVMSSMLSFCSSEAEGISSLSLMPQIQRIMARSLWRSRRNSWSFGPYVSLPWSIAERTQASYALPRILGERCLVVRIGKSFLNFPQGIQHLAAMALSQPHRSTASHLGNRTCIALRGGNNIHFIPEDNPQSSKILG